MQQRHAAQFRTRYFVLYFGVTLLFVRAAIFVVSRGLASESTVGLGGAEGQEAEPCTNAMHQRPGDSPPGYPCGIRVRLWSFLYACRLLRGGR